MVKIVIIGAGISGLSVYLFLQKHLNQSTSSSSSHEIKIYEAYDVHKSNASNFKDVVGQNHLESTKDLAANEPIFTPQAIGSAIGISKNGLNVLSRLDYDHAISGSTPSQGGESVDMKGVHCSLIKEMARRGHPIERWEISTARGWTIVDVNLIPRHLRDSAGDTGGKGAAKVSKSSTTTKDPYMYHSVMIARYACWEILLDRVLQHSPDAVIKKKVIDVDIGDDARPSTVKFEDGTEETADLVIGADGLRSVLRRAMFKSDDDNSTTSTAPGNKHSGKEIKRENQGWLKAVLHWLSFSSKAAKNNVKPDYVTPHYEGLVGVGGFVPSSILQPTGLRPGTMSIVFGPNGFFGYGYLTSTAPVESEQQADSERTLTSTNPNSRPSIVPPTSQPGPLAGWWSTFPSETPYPYASSSSNSGSNNKPYAFDKPLAVSSLLSRHKGWKNPSIAAILKQVETDTSSEFQALDATYPTWTTPELPTWSLRGRAVLVGDAAHALQPSSGQGACQALEDAEALALLLKHHLVKSSPGTSVRAPDLSSATGVPRALTLALAQYETLRSPRVHAIYERSQKMSRLKGDMGLLMEWTMYLLIYAMTWFRDDYNEVLFEYDLPAEVARVIREDEDRAAPVPRP